MCSLLLLQGIPYSNDMCPCFVCFYPDVKCAPVNTNEKCETGTYMYVSFMPEEDEAHHVINDFIWEMSIRTISTK